MKVDSYKILVRLLLGFNNEHNIFLLSVASTAARVFTDKQGRSLACSRITSQSHKVAQSQSSGIPCHLEPPGMLNQECPNTSGKLSLQCGALSLVSTPHLNPHTDLRKKWTHGPSPHCLTVGKAK